jgi:hypothetical protein
MSIDRNQLKQDVIELYGETNPSVNSVINIIKDLGENDVKHVQSVITDQLKIKKQTETIASLQKRIQELESNRSFQLPSCTVAISADNPSGLVHGMFTCEFRNQVAGFWYYKDCKFHVDIHGVLKAGDEVEKIRFDPFTNALIIRKDNKIYYLDVGSFCFNLRIHDD